MNIERIVYVVRAADGKKFVFLVKQAVTDFVKNVRLYKNKKIVILFPVKVDKPKAASTTRAYVESIKRFDDKFI